MNWLRKFFGLCQHKWVIHTTTKVYESHKTEGQLPMCVKYTLQCEHCGDIKVRRT